MTQVQDPPVEGQAAQQHPLLELERPKFANKEVPVETVTDGGVPGNPPSNELVALVARWGVVQPLVVVPAPKALRKGKVEWLVVAGRRRLAAALENGLRRVPIRILEPDAAGLSPSALTVVENSQRSGNPAAELAAIERLVQNAASEDDIVLATGMPATLVRARVKLMSLIPELRKALNEGFINGSLALEAAKLTEAKQRKAAEMLASNGRLTRADIERLKPKQPQQEPVLPPEDAEGWRDASIKRLREAQRFIASALGSDHEAWSLIDAAVQEIEKAQEPE